MIHSMTGYARADAQGPWGRLTWEIRGVNHRYLDLQFKLPDDVRPLENEFRTQATSRLARGKIECGLRYQPAISALGQIEIDADRLATLKSALDLISQQLTAVALPDALNVLSFPGIMREIAPDATALHQAVRTLFDRALSEFTDMRAREGTRLAQLLGDRCDLVDGLIDAVRRRYSEVRAQWSDRLRSKAAELNVQLDPGRFEQELVVTLQRLDIDEELSRLQSHLVEVRAALTRAEPVGRRLDFLMQELNREANTLASKSQDAEMTLAAVEIKVLIEQMREQVQNLE